MTEKIRIICREPEVYCLPIPLPDSPLRSLNAYLIRSQGESLLVDTGFRHPVCICAMEEALRILNVDRGRMRIFITHCHTDHMGSVPDIMRPENQVLLSETEYRMCAGHLEGDYWEQGERRFLSEGFPMAELEQVRQVNPSRIYMPKRMFPAGFVKDGERCRIGAWEWVFMDTRGHSPGHMSLYLPEKEILILGDHVLFDISPNITNWIGVEDSLGDYLNSLDRISALSVSIPLPGHRGAGRGLRERIAELKRHHCIRLEQMLAEIRQKPGMTAYQIASGAQWRMQGKSWEDAPKSQKWFAVGETIAHLDYLRLRGAVSRKMEEGRMRYEI